MDNYSKQQQQDSSLLILLGCDTLYSLDLNKLKSDGKATLELVFSHHNKQPDNSDYPLGMGLYVTHGGSKLHFFGGENLVDSQPQDWVFRLPNIGLDYKRPDLDSLPRNTTTLENKRINLSSEDIDRWLNRKFFSFTLNNSITPLGDHNSNQHRGLCVTPLGDTSTKLPNHFGFKVRPIVVTILGKIYVLTTHPYSRRMPLKYGISGDNSVLFEAFDPNDGKWETLVNPPDDLCDAILGKRNFSNLEIVHCVHREKLLLQTSIGKFLYNASSNEWITMPKYSYPMILASLEYKNFVLAFVLLDPCSDWIAVYDLETFDLETFWKESTNYISILDIVEDREERCVSRASFSLLKDNRICVVLNNVGSQLHVYLFEVIIKLTLPLQDSLLWPVAWLRHSKCEYEQPHQKFDLSAHVLAHQMFRRPQFLHDTYIVTTFLFPEPREEDSWEGNRRCNGKSNTVFVRGLPSSVTTFAIQMLFNVLGFGEIKPNGVFLNRKEHFAFVEFEDVESTYKATKASPIHLAGNIVYIDKVYRTSKSLRMWLRKQKETFKEMSRVEEIAVGRMEEIALS